MIAFTCPACRKKYTVPDEFAGRKTRCRVPTCQKPLQVPIQMPDPAPTVPRWPSYLAVALLGATACGVILVVYLMARRDTNNPTAATPTVVATAEPTEAKVETKIDPTVQLPQVEIPAKKQEGPKVAAIRKSRKAGTPTAD